jgi:hypothetical protein
MEDSAIPPLNQETIQGWGTQICGWSAGIQLESYGILMVIPPRFVPRGENEAVGHSYCAFNSRLWAVHSDSISTIASNLWRKG